MLPLVSSVSNAFLLLDVQVKASLISQLQPGYTPSVTPPCLEVMLNVIVLVDCTKYFVAKVQLDLKCETCFI